MHACESNNKKNLNKKNPVNFTIAVKVTAKVKDKKPEKK